LANSVSVFTAALITGPFGEIGLAVERSLITPSFRVPKHDRLAVSLSQNAPVG